MQRLKKTTGALLCVWVALQDAMPVKLLDWIGRLTVAKDVSQFLREWAIMPATPASTIISVAILIVGIFLLLPSVAWSWLNRQKQVAGGVGTILGVVAIAFWYFWPSLHERIFPAIAAPPVTASVTPSNAPPELDKPRLKSTMLVNQVRCDSPRLDRRGRRIPQVRKLRVTEKALESAYQALLTVTDLPGDYKVELKLTKDSPISMLGFLTNLVVEERILDEQSVLITLVYGTSGGYALLLSLSPTDETKATEMGVFNTLENLFGFTNDQCILL
jgi:hypothetical protein